MKREPGETYHGLGLKAMKFNETNKNNKAALYII